VDLRAGVNLLKNYSFPPIHLNKTTLLRTKETERKEQLANALAD